jgi:hypothetical protein
VPSRKQRRRSAKDRRHDYEYVYVDETGNEVEVDDVAQPSPNGSSPRAAKAKAPAQDKAIQAGRRVIQPPSWRRAARRGFLFSPAIAAFVYFLNRSLPIYGVVLNVLILLAFFIPFGYLMDRVTYRAYTRKLGSQAKKPAAKKPTAKKR